ncbi:uncharacterized protein LOC126619202 [Malus sylvestris]|uniref:uncharacterized protein LOC126619202 n=1 Tax=Malus sylvestris TaxID=3752 RepID=UPI0021ACFC4B|nr:uncharacterized protein LOC126619202 [Malus sylvestris]
MEDKNLEKPIPEGWELKDEGSKTSHYLCPATGQHFSTYEDLMRYVNYAKENKLSIYAPDCKFNKLKRKRRKNKPISLTRKNSGGQSSRPLPVNLGKEREETANPMESNDTGKDTEAGEAGEAGKKSIQAGDLEASEAMKE